jgi:hypothetical protein
MPRALRFHPSPLQFDGNILVPLREATRFYLVRIDTHTLKVRRLTEFTARCGCGVWRALKSSSQQGGMTEKGTA